MLTSLLSFLGLNRFTWKGIPLKSSSSFELREIAKADDDFARKLLSNGEACDALKESDLYSLADTYEFFARGIFEIPYLREKLTATSLQLLGLKYEFVAQEIVNTAALSKKLTADNLLALALKYIYWANTLLQNPTLYKKLESKQVLALSSKYVFFARKAIRNPELSEKLSPEDLETLGKNGPFPPQKNLFKTDFDPKWDREVVPLPIFIKLSFHWALKNNECDTGRIQYLLEEGVDIDERDENDLTPLHVVLNTEHFALAIQFIQQGASSVAVDSNGNTPLHIAVAKGQIAIVELMLKTVMNIDVENKSKSTPLAIATAAKDYAMVEMLLNHGASPAIKDMQGNIPLHIAISQKNEMLALLLLNQSPINVYNSVGHSPFIVALQCNMYNVAVALIRKGANMRAPANDGKTPLYFAIRYCPAIVREFILNKVNLNTLVDVCMNALQLAIQLGNTAVAFQLLEVEARPTAINTSLCPSPLWLAIQLGAPDLVQALIEAGADINEVYNLESLLRITISLNKLAEATLLMKAPGFDQNLHRLCLTENLFVDNIDDAFYSLLIAKGADIDFQNPEGNTPLHVAIAKGDDRKANLLIENGANLSLKNRENETVLHIAIRQQRLLLVKLLISKGGDVKAKPDANANMLQFAVTVSSPSIVNCLLKAADFVEHILENECLVLRNSLPNKAMRHVLFSYLREEAISQGTLEMYPQLAKAYRNYQREVFLEIQRVKFFAYGARKLQLPIELIAFIYSRQIEPTPCEAPITEALPESMSPLYYTKVVKSLKNGFAEELLMTEERRQELRQLKLN